MGWRSVTVFVILLAISCAIPYGYAAYTGDMISTQNSLTPTYAIVDDGTPEEGYEDLELSLKITGSGTGTSISSSHGGDPVVIMRHTITIQSTQPGVLLRTDVSAAEGYTEGMFYDQGLLIRAEVVDYSGCDLEKPVDGRVVNTLPSDPDYDHIIGRLTWDPADISEGVFTATVTIQFTAETDCTAESKIGYKEPVFVYLAEMEL